MHPVSIIPASLDNVFDLTNTFEHLPLLFVTLCASRGYMLNRVSVRRSRDVYWLSVRSRAGLFCRACDVRTERACGRTRERHVCDGEELVGGLIAPKTIGFSDETSVSASGVRAMVRVQTFGSGTAILVLKPGVITHSELDDFGPTPVGGEYSFSFGTFHIQGKSAVFTADTFGGTNGSIAVFQKLKK